MLTPKYMLSLLDKKQFPELLKWNNKVIDLVDRENSKSYNCLTIYKAERQVYNDSNDFRFVEKILKENPKYRLQMNPRVGGPNF
jgi:hypothetical protein